MLDPNLLRKNTQTILKNFKNRGFNFNLIQFQELDNRRKTIQLKIQSFQARRNVLAKLVGAYKVNDQDTSDIMKESQLIAIEIKKLQEELVVLKQNIYEILISLPNLQHHSVPFGTSNKDNIEVRRWIPNSFEYTDSNPNLLNFKPRNHVTLGESLGLDLNLASKLSGSRFSFLRGGIARLHRALAQFMLDLQTDIHGYTECHTPYIVNESTLFNIGQLPKFKDDVFSVIKGNSIEKFNKNDQKDSNTHILKNQFLISTSEVTLTNAVSNTIIPLSDLPIKFTAHTPCFRSEAGSGGLDICGMIRQHQFDKIELVTISHPSLSYKALEDMVSHAEHVLQLLQLPYRVMLLCTGDIGFASSKTYDLEVWLPTQNTWREISSVSNCETFQARRMKARFRNNYGDLEYVHTLNGSALAVGRTLVAVLENYQREDGSVLIPEALLSYMGGTTILEPTKK